MNIVQFVRIIWARRWVVFWATVCCCIGAAIVVLVLPPRWDAHARVMINATKPDPVTGQSMNVQEGRIFAATQIDLVTDPTVAGKVAEEMGWMSDPTFISRYQQRSSSDQRDFRSWLAQIIMDNTKAKVLDMDSNILEITYSGTSADNSKAVVDLLRKVYLDTAVLMRRQDAEKNAEWYEQQADKAKTALDDAINAETTYERQNGIVMATDKLDVESARLQALTANPAITGAPPAIINTAPPQAEMDLAVIDSQLASASKTLGPNNPEMIALKERRTQVAKTVETERAQARAMSSTQAANSGAFESAVRAQKSRVIADSSKIGRLSQLQNDVNLKREELIKLQARIMESRQQALTADAGLSPLGAPSTPKEATFPNYLLIVPGAILGGAFLGILVAVLMELLARRVRGADDLAHLDDLPLIGVIAGPGRSRRSGGDERGRLRISRPSVAGLIGRRRVSPA